MNKIPLLITTLVLCLADTSLAQTSETRTPEAKQRKPVRKQPENPAATFADVAYGKHERNVLDFWKAAGEGPRPLRIHIHGGGWLGGDKSRIKNVQSDLKKGISVASINYRLTKTDPLPAPVHDAARALQFLRTKAKDWNIDKDKIVLTGGSAGACTAMWIACHDDLAKPDSDDPVERESTRVLGAAVAGGQTSIDPKQAEPWIGPKVYHGMIIKAVGEETIEDVLKNYDKHEALYKEFSPYNHLTKDDPPLFLFYHDHMEIPAASFPSGIHHGMFGVKMKEKSDEVGHKKVYLSIKEHQQPAEYANNNDFMEKLLLRE